MKLASVFVSGLTNDPTLTSPLLIDHYSISWRGCEGVVAVPDLAVWRGGVAYWKWR